MHRELCGDKEGQYNEPLGILFTFLLALLGHESLIVIVEVESGIVRPHRASRSVHQVVTDVDCAILMKEERIEIKVKTTPGNG